MSNEVISQKRERYQLNKTLGQGGMGVVYLAKDLLLERQVAVKCLKLATQNNDINGSDSTKGKLPNTASYTASQASLHKRLQKEANTLAQLNHPNIVQIYDIIDDEQGFALVMEYIEGNTLTVQLREHITSFKQRLIWLKQIAEGLAAAHAKNLIHRDLKTDNILINKDNIAKITDFGIAKNTLNTNNNTIDNTKTGNFIGSYSVLSPEQALGKPVDNRSDLFSFGILAFKLICGYHPFGESNNQNVIVQNILNQAPLPAKHPNENLDEGLLNLLNNLLMKNPDQRPANANIVSQQLQLFIDNCIDNANEPTFAETECFEIPQYEASKDGSSINQNNSKINAEIRNKNKKRTVIMVGGFVAALFLVLTSVWYWNNKQSQSLYVAVLPPIINPDSLMSEGQQQLLTEAFNSAMQQQIINTPGLHLISQQQVANSTGDYAQRGKALGADVLLESILKCEEQRCQVELNRIEEAKTDVDKDTETLWTVKQQLQWPMIVDLQYLSTTFEVKQRLSQLFPSYPNTVHFNPLGEAAYQEFLKYRFDIYSNEQYTAETWSNLWQLQGRYQHYLPYYQLMSYLGRMLYDESGNEVYLTQLSTLLSTAEEYMGIRIELLDGEFEIALRQQAYEKATKLIDKMLEINSDKVKVLIKRGLLASFKGEYKAADTLYQQALVLRPSIKLLYRIANNHFYQGNSKGALEALDALNQLNPNYLGSLRLKALIYLYDGQLSNAIPLYQKFIKENPTSSLYNNLGLIYELQGKYKQAELSFRKAVELNPDNNLLRLNLADSLKLQGKITKATELYQIVIDSSLIGTEDWSEYLKVALAEIQLENTANALTALHNSLRLAGEDAEVIFNAALIYSIAEQWPVALSYVEESLRLGYDKIWFDLPWFDGLCQAEASTFNQLLIDFSQNLENDKSQFRCKD
ncbi:MAG: protein kinase [Saccharospirillaceae bacterium]|nr:protein kinase [Pseudomonadales bacterium]NRB80821.1 protein kinase [Saccharospirillaceae bacterium]